MPAGPRSSPRPPLASLCGMLLLSYLLGATVMHFKLPSSEVLHDAFDGGQAWYEQRQTAAPVPTVHAISHDVDKPQQTCDGFTLYTSDKGAQATLLDMQGRVVHRWTTAFSRIWPRPPHVPRPVEDAKVYLFACHLYANGDLLAVLHGTGDTPYGYGLAKLDRDARVLWTYDANAHHAVDVGEDGTIYVLTQQIIRAAPPGLGFLPMPALVDYLVLLSPEGKELKKIALLEAFQASPYRALIPAQDPLGRDAWDVLHANHVEVLTRARAPHFPLFKAGQVLISVREMDAVAMLDPETARVTWAARGPWRGQHDPHFLDTGRLLVFDNRGSSRESRVLEYDPQTQACPWSYASEDSPAFITLIQGRSQRLANGNTLIVNSKDGMLFEVTDDRELVWSCYCRTHMPFARRYTADQLTFLPGDVHAR